MVAVEIRLGRRRIGEMVEETVPQYLQQAVAGMKLSPSASTSIWETSRSIPRRNV
jgi:hypothetical protein